MTCEFVERHRACLVSRKMQVEVINIATIRVSKGVSRKGKINAYFQTLLLFMYLAKAMRKVTNTILKLVLFVFLFHFNNSSH